MKTKTSTLTTANLETHGNFTIICHRQIYYIKAYGTWNDDLAKRYGKAFYAYARTLCREPWAIFADASQWRIGTTEVWERFAQQGEWSDKHNLTHMAVIIGDSTFSLIEAALLEKNHDLTQVRIFKSKPEAFTWLQEAGYFLEPKVIDKVFKPITLDCI